ncbi:13413_t:CDS:2, partial [Entrophospora sp. SA101]
IIKTKSPSSTSKINDKHDRDEKTDLYESNEMIKTKSPSSTSKINDKRDKYEKTTLYDSNEMIKAKSLSSTYNNKNKRYRDEKQIFTSLTKGRKQNHYNRRLKLTINMRRQNFMNQTIRLKPNHLHQRLTITAKRPTFMSLTKGLKSNNHHRRLKLTIDVINMKRQTSMSLD